ncbi:MAG: hypothetical protein ICV87_04900 [Gemmatimonadetes bacterium]|nr:hypothetical protein [Gemmatimonadota bacterium]
MRRAEVLRRMGAGEAETAELLAHNRNLFQLPEGGPPPFPLPDEPFVEAWAGYAAEARERGVLPVLRERLVQLRFPVRAGISDTDAYRRAVRGGELPDGCGGLELARPDALRLELHPTPAGRIPVLTVEDRGDFVQLLRALTCRSEPVPVPGAQGACMVAGYVNWDRVAGVRRAWEAGDPLLGAAPDWAGVLPRLRERRELYQDRFVLLSSGPYSGVAAAEARMSEEAWRAASAVIRREHECAHYFTRRLFGAMSNHPLDELIADYSGIVAAAGVFRADWFLRFMGLEGERLRADGRLHGYRGTLSAGAFEVLQRLVRAAALQLEAADRELAAGGRDAWTVVWALASLTLEELAEEGAERIVGAARRPVSAGRAGSG